MMFDEDLRGFSDADIEQSNFEAEGNRLAANEKRGICSHGWWQGGTVAQINAMLAAAVLNDNVPELRKRYAAFAEATFPAVGSVKPGEAVCLNCGAVFSTKGGD